MFSGENIRVFDLEMENSPDDCRNCGLSKEAHAATAGFCPRMDPMEERTAFEPLGWSNKAALGLSIGAYYDYRDGRVHWFDRENLEDTVRRWVTEQPLLVGFNSIQFDATLMRGILRRQADEYRDEAASDLGLLCDQFKSLAASSYDILAEIWASEPHSKFERGLNSLDALLAANGLPAKSGHGAEAPRDWQEGKRAKVMNYCQDDVLLTKRLFELISSQGGNLMRRDGEINIRHVCAHKGRKPGIVGNGCTEVHYAMDRI